MPGLGRSARGAVVALLLALPVSGCGTADGSDAAAAAEQYFAENNAAAKRGPAAQQRFFGATQHPDFTARVCELGGMTVELDPALTTLRPDPGFAPTGTRTPRGELWVVGVEVTTRRSGTIIGRQIGSVHLALLEGRTFGFAPCPR